ncbi:ABC transporter substrate-binding protein [Streptomyces coffeae]|uniref:ABC transporter substrate-binding protein n=1 Tax=Streptomyces coffeae TaxID=621382 RepID=UPI0027DE67A1|nr:ABC transporter substrate-binding protein [Streptomyces coffeae]
MDKAIVLVVSLTLIAGLSVVVWSLLPEECGDGLEKSGGECVGVTEKALADADPELKDLVHAVARENVRVRKDWEAPEGGKPPMPYVRIALMMPFTSDASSAMTIEQIRRGVAGAHTAQLRANSESGPHYQLLLANDGKDLNHWRPVVDRLTAMVDDKAPLIGVIGMPSSNPETLHAVQALSDQRIPAVGPIITSSDMNAKYFFKTSPSNGLFAEALAQYLAEEPGTGKGFLVSDNRPRDNYSIDLRKVFLDRFDEKYGLRKRQAYFLGAIGAEAGIPRRFSSAAQKICVTGADTVFYAGRDGDLPDLVSRLAKEPSCDDAKPLRILTVGIGIDPVLTTPDLTRQMRESKITLVDAASVDPQWWTRSPESRPTQPPGLAGFLQRFEALGKEQDLGERPLDDGYAIMYHDAFTVLSQAVDQTFNDVNDSGKKSSNAPGMPTNDDVYNTIIDMNILGTADGADCVNCVRGASGTYGFDDSHDTQKWPVCKPVPVIEYPPPSAASTAGKKPRTLYRTHEDIFDGACP